MSSLAHAQLNQAYSKAFDRTIDSPVSDRNMREDTFHLLYVRGHLSTSHHHRHSSCRITLTSIHRSSRTGEAGKSAWAVEACRDPCHTIGKTILVSQSSPVDRSVVLRTPRLLVKRIFEGSRFSELEYSNHIMYILYLFTFITRCLDYRSRLRWVADLLQSLIYQLPSLFVVASAVLVVMTTGNS